MKKTVIMLCLLALFICGQAQKPKTVTVKAQGIAYIFDNITPEQATDKALANAKIEALKKANVPENIYSVTLVNLGSSENEFSEISSELGKISIDGLVLIKNKSVSTKVKEDNKTIEVVVDIVADVVVEKQKIDPTFTLKIEGLNKTTYRDNEPLTFSVFPYQDCYIRVFWLNHSLKGAGDLLFPYQNVNKDEMFLANRSYSFPLSDPHYLAGEEFEYMMMKENQEPYEKVILFIVALKQKIPFNQEVTYDNVIKWLFTIDKSERCEFWYPVMIVK